ncbi:MAG: M42 family metallopeptidase [Capsulimonadales bacterium]|nr:M42 family metallopeptidase [Capsulimonadales bacterium]
MNFELLRRLCETPGVPSREEHIRRVVMEEMQPYVHEVIVDTMGNVIGHKKGMDGPVVMLAAHMDEIGFIVKHIDDRGFLRLHPLGGFDPRNLIAQRVHVHGFGGDRMTGVLQPGTKPVHMQADDEKGKPFRLHDLFVDLGMSGDQVRARVEIGDPVTMARETEIVGSTVVSKALDNRVSLYVMIEALRLLGAHQCEIYAVATTQEEVGLRGAITSAYHLQPDVGIAIDITVANDFPGPSETDRVTELGKGPALKIVDSSTISHPKVVRHFRDVASMHEIPYQLEVLPMGGTDAGGIQRSRQGVPAFTLSIPTRYVHTVNEMASIADIDCAVTLLQQYLEEMHVRPYRFDI